LAKGRASRRRTGWNGKSSSPWPASQPRHRFTGNYSWEGAARDQQYVQRLAVKRPVRAGPKRHQRRLLAKAEHLLADERHWEAVELIAAELLRCGEISGRTAGICLSAPVRRIDEKTEFW